MIEKVVHSLPFQLLFYTYVHLLHRYVCVTGLFLFSSTAAQQLLDRPLDGEVAQVGVVLPDADEQDGHVGRVDEADERSHHVADGVALGDDEAVEGADGAEGGVEVAGLGDRVGADEGLWELVSYEG